MNRPTFSIVIPVYQNEENLYDTFGIIQNYYETIKQDMDLEVVFVNDGSTDDSLNILLSLYKKNPELVRVINLSRNFGQVAAWDAGISNASGDVIGVISADMQDPIKLFSDMLLLWQQGKKIVFGVREDREDSGIGDMFSKLFHKLINKISQNRHPVGGSDFFLIDKLMAEHVAKIYEKNGHTVMLLSWLGYDYGVVKYARRKREKGVSQWGLWKKIKLLIDSFVINSYLPLRLVSLFGIASCFFTIIYTLFLFIQWFLFSETDNFISGWTTVVLLITFFSGSVLMSLGIIGEYIWRIYDETRKRPKFIVESDTKKPLVK